MLDYPLFPQLRGFAWARHMTPRWKTMIQTSESGLERRWERWNSPIWLFSLPVGYLLSDTTSINDLKKVIGFFNALRGASQPFLVDVREDKSVPGAVNQLLGVGDGVTSAFQLVHRYAYDYGEWVEVCKYINPRKIYGYGEGGYGEYPYGTAESPYIYLDGVAQYEGYSINEAGVVQFATPPASGVQITADFSYFYRVRFDGDEQDFQNLLKGLWDIQTSGSSGGGSGINLISLKDVT